MITRFPPEPNGRLHLGHARSVWLNATLAAKFGGSMNLRMDDTNPEKEDISHEHAIVESLRHLNIKWAGDIRYASDHFLAMHSVATALIRKGLAYIDTSDKDTMRSMRGDLHNGGTRSNDANLSLDWHLSMFERMTTGEFEDGSLVLRAKIDMSSPNINLRDPVLYRIKHMAHARTGSTWCIYPSYDFAHPFCDVAEGISLSLCTLEFEDHRPLYDWVCEHVLEFFPGVALHKPVELEFSRLEITNGLTSKRKINALVVSGKVDGYDDPRLLTLDGLRRRGFPPNVIFKFIEDCGIGRSNGSLPFSRLEDTLRLELDATAPRRVIVLDPVPMDIEGFPNEMMSTIVNNHPKDGALGTRTFGVSSSIWIERDDIRLPGTAEKGFKRLEVGAYVRLMNIGVIECLRIDSENDCVKKVYARFVPEAKARATIHALSRAHSVPIDVVAPSCVGSEDDPDDCMERYNAMVEPCALTTTETFHAIRVGYLIMDCSHHERLILTATLKKGFS